MRSRRPTSGDATPGRDANRRSRSARRPSRGRRLLATVVLPFLGLLLPEGKDAGMSRGADPIRIADLDRAAPVMFEADVLPILRRHCLACHDRHVASGDLVLESRDEILAGGSRGPAIVPGEGDGSLLLQLAAHRRDPPMPRGLEGAAATTLTPDELGVIRLWIDQGARVAGSGGVKPPSRGSPWPVDATPALAVSITPDGRVGASAVGNRLWLHDVAHARPIGELLDAAAGGDGAHRDLIGALAFDAAGETLASGGFREVKLWHRPAIAKAWQTSAGSGTPLLAVSPDGRTVAVAAGTTVRTWGADGAAGRELVGTGDRITAIAFDVDGRMLLAAGADGAVRIMGVADGIVRGVVETPAPVAAIAVLPPTKGGHRGTFVVAGADNRLRAYGIPERAPQKFLTTPVPDRRAVSTADRRWLAVADPDAEGRVVIEVMAIDGAGRTEPQAGCRVPGPVTALELVANPGGNGPPRILVGGADGSLSLVEPGAPGAEGTLRARWRGVPARVTALATSADGRRLASALDNGQTSLWRGPDDGGESPPAPSGIADVALVAHHPARRLVAVAGAAAGRPVIRVLRLEGMAVAATLDGHEGGTTALCFSADGSRIVSAGADGTVRLADWSEAGGAEVRRFSTGSPPVAVGVSPDLAMVIAAGADRVVRTWTVADGMPGRDLEGHPERIVAVGFAAGNQPWSIGVDRVVRFWNLADARQSASWELQSPPTAVTLGSDGTTLVAAGEDRLVRTQVLATGQILQTFTGHASAPHALHLAADGRRLLSVERLADRDSLLLWDAPTGRLAETREIPAADGERTLAVLADGTGDGWVRVVADGSLRPHDPFFRRFLEVGQQMAVGLAFVGAAEQVVVAASDGSIRGHHPDTGQPLFAAGHGAPIRALAVEGEAFATGAADGSVRLWQAGGGALGVHGINGLGGEVTALSFAPGAGRVVVAAAATRPTITVHDTASGSLVEKLTGHVRSPVHLRTLEDGDDAATRWVVSVSEDGGWRSPSVAGPPGGGPERVPTHGGAITALEPLPGRPDEVLTGCADGIARRIRLGDGEVLAQYAHGGPIGGVAVSPDGNRLATCGENRIARLWTLDGGAVAELRGDERLRATAAARTRSHAAATERVTRLRGIVETADRGVATATESLAKATAAVAAAGGEVQQRSTAARQANDAAAAAERVATAAVMEVRGTALAKGRADQVAREVELEHRLATKRVELRTALAAAAPADAGRAQAAAEAATIAAQVAQRREAGRAAATTAAQAAAAAATASADAGRKAREARLAAAEAGAALVAAEAGGRSALDAEGKARHALELAQREAHAARQGLTRGEAVVGDAKGRLDAATAAAAAAEQPVRRVAFSPDSARLLGAGDHPAFLIWDAGTGAPLASLPGSPSAPVGAGFLAGSRLVSLAADGALAVWETDPPWRLSATIGGAESSDAIPDRVTSLQFSPDGATLVVSGGVPGRGGEVALFRVADGVRLRELPPARDGVVRAARFSPEGRRLATLGGDAAVVLLDAADATLPRRLEGHARPATGIAWKADGTEVASAGTDATVRFWDADTGAARPPLAGFPEAVTAVGYRGETAELVTACGDGVVRIHGADGQTLRSSEPLGSWIVSLALSSDGARGIAGGADGRVSLLDLERAAVLGVVVPPPGPAGRPPAE